MQEKNRQRRKLTRSRLACDETLEVVKIVSLSLLMICKVRRMDFAFPSPTCEPPRSVKPTPQLVLGVYNLALQHSVLDNTLTMLGFDTS